jgi:crotonobetainyl-CoA:carnitine CoA-transferase CaiB-like acyl-CoA transferase
VLIAANQDSVFHRLVKAMGAPELIVDPRFVDHQARGRHMNEIDAIIAEWTRHHTSADVLTRLHEAGVPAGLVYEPRDMIEDSQFAARESLARVEDTRHGELVMQAVVPKLSETPGSIRWAGEALGADTDAVLTEVLGLSTDEIDELRRQAVI